jgi:hypothetical protein
MDSTPDESSRVSSRGDWNSLLVGGLVGALIVGLVAWLANSLSDSWLAETRLIQQLREARGILTGWDLLAFPVLILIVLGTHEVGHLLGGLSQGMRFLMLIVGPLGWHASASGPRFEWNTNLALMGGLAAALPTQVGTALRRQSMMLVAGGPLASFVLAMVALGVALVSGPRMAAYGTFVAATSFGIFLITLMPVRSGGFLSDGMQIWDLLQGGSASIEKNALLQIFVQSRDGVRPRDWDAAAIDTLREGDSNDPLSRTGSWLLLLARAMDCRHDADIVRYQALLEKSVGGYPTGFRQAIFVELAICAWLAGDTEAVRRHLKASRGGIVEKSRRFLAEAALAKLEGRDEDCERNRLLAIQSLAKEFDAGQRQLTEDQLAMLQGRPSEAKTERPSKSPLP